MERGKARSISWQPSTQSMDTTAFVAIELKGLPVLWHHNVHRTEGRERISGHSSSKGNVTKPNQTYGGGPEALSAVQRCRLFRVPVKWQVTLLEGWGGLMKQDVRHPTRKLGFYSVPNDRIFPYMYFSIWNQFKQYLFKSFRERKRYSIFTLLPLLTWKFVGTNKR